MLVCAGFLEMRKNMIRHDSFFKRLKRGGSLFLAVLLAVQSFFMLDLVLFQQMHRREKTEEVRLPIMAPRIF